MAGMDMRFFTAVARMVWLWSMTDPVTAKESSKRSTNRPFATAQINPQLYRKISMPRSCKKKHSATRYLDRVQK